MAAPFVWVQMILKNHIGVIAIWAAVFGLAGYTALRDMPELDIKPLPAIQEKSGEYNEIVIPTNKPHVCKVAPHSHPEIESIKDHEAGPLH